MLKWDDVRYFLAIARTESLGAAAQRLGVDHSTVLRRMQAIEDTLQARLFLRVGAKRRLSAAGRDVLPLAERIEAGMRAIELEVAARDQRRSGPIKVSTPDGLAVAFMPGLIQAFHDANPDVRIELLMSNVPLNLTTREADIELRPTRQPSGDAKGRKVGRIAFGIYASHKAAAERRSRPEAASEATLASYDWIMPDPAALPIYTPADWIRGLVPRQRVVATASSAVVMRAMVQQGVGVAALPCYLGDSEPSIRRLMLLDRLHWGDLWLLTHPDLSRVARVRAFLDHTARYLASQRARFEGRVHGQAIPSDKGRQGT